MQDIVFYAAANETLGVVRDYANSRKVQAPVLTIGVSVCLRMRLFADLNTSKPYPVSAFAGISDWQWRMDGDFDQATTCKLVADTNDISVQSVSDTINGETISFTEFMIPISDMNTQELQAWLGNEKKRSGLTGELIGYDSAEKAAFVLQIENFTVRNRVAGLGNPTSVDLETVTYDQAANMIQTAVSSSAATKQDKLSSANAGTGISIAEGGTISTANVPQSAITGLAASLAAKQDNITAGDLLEFTSGTALNRKRYMPVFKEAGMSKRSITPAGGTASVQALVLEPGNAYQVNAVSASKWFATTASFKESSEQWGLESHIELFVAGTGYVRTDTNVVLANALEPDAVNNCTVRFHDGLAIISVEDHVAGYIVVSATGSTAGTLAYGLGSSTQGYAAFDATVDGQTLDMGGAVTNGEKHVVGNGYNDTIVTGGVSCTSKTTFANLGMVNVSVLGGTMTLGDVFIPQGGTVSVSGGGLAIEKAVGSGGVIDLGGTNVAVSSGTTATASGCTFSGGSGSRGGAIDGLKATVLLTNCDFAGNTAEYGGGVLNVQSGEATVNGGIFQSNTARYGGVIYIGYNGIANFSNTVCSSNTATDGGGVAYLGAETSFATFTNCVLNGNTPNDIRNIAGSVTLSGSTVGSTVTSGGNITMVGANSIDKLTGNKSGTVTISNDAIIDLTGNTNNPAISPGGGISFAPGGATVYPSAGSASAYVLGGMTVPQIGNTNMVNLSGTHVVISSGATAYASGCTFSGGSATEVGGAFALTNECEASFVSCNFAGNSTTTGGGCIATKYPVHISGCSFSDTNYAGQVGRDLYVYRRDTGIAYLDGDNQNVDAYVLQDGAIVLKGSNSVRKIAGWATSGGYVTISSGALVDLISAQSNAIVPSGAITLYCGTGANGTYLVTGGNISRFYKDADRVVGSTITNGGIIYGATVYFPSAENTYEVGYTTDSGTTYQTVDVTGTTEYVVTGGLMSLQQKTV
jgi:hypothetical protein